MEGFIATSMVQIKFDLQFNGSQHRKIEVRRKLFGVDRDHANGEKNQLKCKKMIVLLLC